MKTAIIIGTALLCASGLSAQTPINKSIPVAPGQTISMHFDYPNLIRITTWDKNEIAIQGTVSINTGANDDAFELEAGTSGGQVTISNNIRNMKDIPRRITVVRGGKKMTFLTKGEFEKYRKENGGGFEMHSEGIDMDILLEIKVPKGVKTSMESTYGMVEVKEFNGPLKVKATYGGVDAAIAEGSTGELNASTNYGQIYSNLAIKFDSEKSREENFHTYVTAKPGAGPVYTFESQYGNVYLRKPVAQ